MNKNIILTLIVILTSFKYGLQGDKLQLFKSILKTTESNILEFGLKSELLTKNIDIVQEIKKNFKIEISKEISEYKISNDDLYADINIYNINNVKNLEIKIKFKKGFLITKEIMPLLQSNNFYFIMEKKDKSNYKPEIISEILDTNKVRNIKKTKFDKITCITGYTNLYNKIYVNGRKIDINLVITNYSNEKHLLIGSPVLLTNY